MSSYVFGKPVSIAFDQAVVRITEELAKQGFGVLTDIDVQATMKKKLGQEMPAYRILGACNPGMASQALAADPQIGSLLPCNVVVRQDAQGTVYVEAMDPSAVLTLVDHPAVPALAAEVRRRLQLALDGLA
ncbi:MAG TPA: DUF302 domain-containing protein [Burkholderiaceae bacterium]